MSRITRKELATKISVILGEDVSVDRVRKNEKAWGLVPKRQNKRVVRYDEAAAIAAFRRAVGEE